MSWQADKDLRIQALPVDNEPTSFWTGDDRVERVSTWKRKVGWQADWGHVEAAGETFNGSSGRSVRDDVIGPLGAPRTKSSLTGARRGATGLTG